MNEPTDEILPWLQAAIDEDELWALAASAPLWPEDGPTVAGGVHWTWAVGDNWEPINVDPLAEYVGEDHGGSAVNLITRESWPTRYGNGRTINHQVLEADEVRTGDAGHIVRWDPARVLLEIAIKRLIIEAVLDYMATIDRGSGCCHGAKDIGAGQCPDIRPNQNHILRLFALPYADRAGYREEWKP